MRCPNCEKDLGNEEIVVVIQGTILCKLCAEEQYSTPMLAMYGEEIRPSDAGIEPECEWCGEEQENLIFTNLGMLCYTCIAAIRSRGETVREVITL